MPTRTLVVWCPDWPVIAHRRPMHLPIAALHANRVVAASPVARSQGVVRGLRRREAQSRCPTLVVLERDEALEARAFEDVLGAIEHVAPRVQVLRPGVVAVPTRGPSRYFGGDEALAQHFLGMIELLLDGWGTCRVGVADGHFAAHLAARHAGVGVSVRVVPSGGTPEFLGPLPIGSLERPHLTDVLKRLGMRTLGQFAALSPADVVGRFGAEGAWAHRLARGLEARPLATSLPPPDLEVSREIDPPLERIDQAAFLGRTLATEFHDRMSHLGIACTQILIIAETEHGEELARCWRHEGALSSAAVADRLRWQLEGWLHASPTSRPSGGLVKLVVRPNDVMAASGRQLGFWGERTEATERAIRAVARIQGLLGPEQVKVPERRGGRSPHEQLTLVAAEVVDLARDNVEGAGGGGAPWPGMLPAPWPALLHDPPLPAQLLDTQQCVVRVTGRGELSAEPAWVTIDQDPTCALHSWAGPWPLDERWWDPERHRRRARMQVVTATGDAHLLSVERGAWQVEASYD